MGLIAEQWANSSGHWYTTKGEPCYEIVGKNGARRNTTLADARRENLVPSVTTIMRLAAAPALERWKIEQVLLAALTLPRLPGEPDADYCARIIRDSQEQGKQAADDGSLIHGAIEAHHRGEPYPPQYARHVAGACAHLGALCGQQEWLPERSFAHPLGYAGKCDLHSPQWVVDTKTKEFSEATAVKVYDDHAIQLAAYRRGLGVPQARCAILFVSRTVPGLCALVEIPEKDLQKGLGMFDCLLKFWQVKTGHLPAFTSRAA